MAATPIGLDFDPAAVELCIAAATSLAHYYDGEASMDGAYTSTAAQIASLQEAQFRARGLPSLPSDLRLHDPDQRTTMCFYKGDFGPPLTPRPDGTADAYDRGIWTVIDGTAELFALGYVANHPVVDPASVPLAPPPTPDQPALGSTTTTIGE